MAKKQQVSEPDFQQACTWWEDLPNIWTPIGWREHLFRFNVLWNGTLFAQPHLNGRSAQWAGQGVQIAFAPHYTEWFGEWGHPYLRHDDRQVNQGWNDADAPVLWTEWARDGLVLRQEIFAHIPGGGDTATGIEPLFAWIRLRVHGCCAGLPLEDVHGFNLLVFAPHVGAGMSTRDNIHFAVDQSRYPRELKADPESGDLAGGLRLLEPDGKVRLGVLPRAGVPARWIPPAEKVNVYRLYLQMSAKVGAHVDVLVPLLPADREVFDKEMQLGYDGALRSANAYWRRVTASACRVETPEPEINAVIRHSVRFSHVLTERNPATNKLCKINGSWVYAALWTTPGAMDLVMMMDTLGHHDTVARYLDIFRDEQGTVKPPGDAFELHPGFLSTPAAYKSIDWLSDNGAVLYTICMHALLSGDRDFAARFADCIVKSCDWIKTVRAKTGHGGYEGVLPPAVATDAGTKIQAVWSIGWNYKGLCAAVRVLRQLNHPRAEEFAAEAADYRAVFLKALRDKCRKMATWRDRQNRTRRFVPTSLAGEEKAESRHAFYLDTGPLFLVFAGLMDARDPLMEDTRRWFREGPQTGFYRRDSNCWQVPVLDHEMSSCEPCYSWNVFHTWQLGDRRRFLEGMYSLFAGSLSRKTGISCETRGGITGNVFASPLAIYMARLAVIDDQIREGELHLLRLVPLAWLKTGAAARFDQVPTEYGPVTLRTKMARDGKTLDVTFQPAFRGAAPKVIVHVPPVPGLKKIKVNGVVKSAKGTICL